MEKTYSQLSQNILSKRRHTPLFSQRRNGTTSREAEKSRNRSSDGAVAVGAAGPPLRRAGSTSVSDNSPTAAAVVAIASSSPRKSKSWMQSVKDKMKKVGNAPNRQIREPSTSQAQALDAMTASEPPPPMSHSDSEDADYSSLVDEVYG